MPRNIIFPLERLLLLFHDRMALRQVFPGPCLQNRRGIDAVVVYTRQTRSKPPSAIERSLSVIKVQDSTCNLKFEHAKKTLSTSMQRRRTGASLSGRYPVQLTGAGRTLLGK
jgi:hypothetical protein